MSSLIPEGGVLRHLTIYCASNGPNTMFPSHVITARVVDADRYGNVVWSNVTDTPEVFSGSFDKGFHAALLTFLPKWKPLIAERLAAFAYQGTPLACEDIARELDAPRTLTIVDSGWDAVFKGYSIPAATLIASKFRDRYGHPIGNAAWVAKVLLEAEELGVTVTSRAVMGDHERTMLETTRLEGKRRWKRASKELERKFSAD